MSFNPWNKSQPTKAEKEDQDNNAEDRPSDAGAPHMFTKAQGITITDTQMINAGRDVSMTYLGSDPAAYGYRTSQTTSQQTVYQGPTVQTSPGNGWGDRNPYLPKTANPTPQTGDGNLTRTVNKQNIDAKGNIKAEFFATGNLTNTTTNASYVTKKSYTHTSRGRNVQETFDGCNIEADEDVNISSFSGGGW